MSASLTLQASNGTVDARAGWPSKWPIDFCPAIFACNDNPLPGTPLFNAKTPTGLTAQLILCGTVGTLCFLLFCFLRVRWTAMYSPRLRMKKHAPETLPSSFFGWIIPLIRIPHSVVLEKVGLDAVVLLQFLLMGAKLFGLCGFFGTVVLLPISRMGGDLANSTDPETPEDEQAAVYSPSYLWVYLFFTYFFCFATFYFTFVNYRDYVRIRREFLLRTAKTLPARTILVTGIPPNLRSDRKLAEYFEQLGIGVVESVHIIRHVNRLLDYIKERAQYLQLLERAYARYWGNPCTDTTYDPDALLRDAEQDQSIRAIDWYGNSQSLPTHAKPRNRPKSKTGFLGLFGKTVDAIEYYTEQFNEIDNLVMRARKFGKFLPTSVGFVTFEHSVSACIASQVLIDSTPFRVQAELAPEPRNVLWENIAMHNRERMIRKGVILCILIFLVFFWVIPISYFSALTSVNSLRNYFPWLMNLASKNKILQQIVQGFLPTLGVVIFMAILPLIVGVLSAMEGFQTRSEAEESSFSKHFFFLLFNVLLVFTVSSTLFKTLTSMIEDPKQIANILAATLPQVAPFFVNYTVLHGVMLLPIQLLQIGPIILNTFWRIFFCKTPRDYAEVSAPRMFNYGWGYPTPVFLFVVLLVYSTSAPIILVFGTFYYLLAYIVFKYQLLYVYFHPYEVAGRMWPKVFSRLIVGLLLFELMSVGLFALKKAYPLAVLCVPLIVLTILFKITVDAAYLRSTRFLPLQLLTQRLGAPDTVATPLAVPNPQPSTSDRSVRAVDGGHKVQLRRRRTVLDQDDYNAEPTTHTDFKQPPMTLVPGILNTGMKRYGHPALLGALPQLWLPVPDKKFRQHPQEQANGQKPAATSLPINAARDNGRLPGNSMVESPSDMSPTLYNGNRRLTGERQPLLSVSPDGAIPRDLIRIPEDEGSSFDSSSSEDEGHARATYYHHPERRYSRIVLGTSSNTRSYGAV